MEINSVNLPQPQSATAGGNATVTFEKQPVNAQQVAPTREATDSNTDVRQPFNADRLIKLAIKRNVVADQRDLFNYRITRYADRAGLYFTFTNVADGNTTTVAASDLFSNSAVDTAI